MLSLERTPEPWLLGNPGPSSAAQPVNPACFSGGWPDAEHRPFHVSHFMQVPFCTGAKCSHSTPQRLQIPGLFRPVFSAPNTPEFWADKPVTRCLNRLTEWWFRNPFGSDRRGPKTHSRRTGRKLVQDPCARQGLVRVPESNTKYGGKRGITGGAPAPVIDPSISESSEIPKPKKLFGGP
jgi:hypothetical protein